MTEQNNETPPPAADPGDAGQSSGQSDPPKPTETVDFWKQKAREQEKRAKDNADAASELAKIKAASQTEAEKQAERLAAAEQRAVELEARANRAQVAEETGVPSAILAGPENGSPEAIKAFAELITKHLEQAGKPRPPKPDPAQGRQPGAGPTDPRSADLAQIEADLLAAKRR